MDLKSPFSKGGFRGICKGLANLHLASLFKDYEV